MTRTVAGARLLALLSLALVGGARAAGVNCSPRTLTAALPPYVAKGRRLQMHDEPRPAR